MGHLGLSDFYSEMKTISCFEHRRVGNQFTLRLEVTQFDLRLNRIRLNRIK